MSRWRSNRRSLVGSAVGILTVVLWSAATIPSGFPAEDLLVFTGPGAVLAVAGSWISHVFSRGAWRWADGAKAAVLGALLLPPALAFAIALLSAFSGGAVVVIFVYGAWVALGFGLVAAAIRDLASGPGARIHAIRHRWARRHAIHHPMSTTNPESRP